MSLLKLHLPGNTPMPALRSPSQKAIQHSLTYRPRLRTHPIALSLRLYVVLLIKARRQPAFYLWPLPSMSTAVFLKTIQNGSCGLALSNEKMNWPCPHRCHIRRVTDFGAKARRARSQPETGTGFRTIIVAVENRIALSTKASIARNNRRMLLDRNEPQRRATT